MWPLGTEMVTLGINNGLQITDIGPADDNQIANRDRYWATGGKKWGHKTKILILRADIGLLGTKLWPY